MNKKIIITHHKKYNDMQYMPLIISHDMLQCHVTTFRVEEK